MLLHPAAGLSGEITVPGDKSISHRALMLGALAQGKTKITNFLPGADCLSTSSCLRQLGVTVRRKGTEVVVEGLGLHGLKAPEKKLDAGNSGTTTRLLCGILAAQEFESVLDGDPSLRSRPMARVIKPLSLMGAQLSARSENFCPIKIHGSHLQGIDYAMSVASAQLKSAILLAGLYASDQTSVREPAPSRDHTEKMLRYFGAQVEQKENRITIYPTDRLTAAPVEVPGDFSSAAFFLVAALILPNSCVTVKNVGVNPTRTGLLDALDSMGADIRVENLREGAEPIADLTACSSSLHGITVGGDLIPRMIDELPILAVAASFARGKTVIQNAEELKVKESNRIDLVSNELSKAGVQVEPTEDGMVIQGGSPIKGTCFTPHKDHRVAMASAILSLAASSPSQILDADCVNVSFPGFYELLDSLRK